MDNSFVKTPEEVCHFFSVDSSKGLKDTQVKEQQKKFGKNGKIRSSLSLILNKLTQVAFF
jgi:succinyl-CoA synthetase beta subunit